MMKRIAQQAMYVAGLAMLLGLLPEMLTGCSGTTDVDIRPARLGTLKSTAAIHPVWYQQPQLEFVTVDSYLRPAVDDARFYVADQNGIVRALNREDGQRIWRVNTQVSLSGGLGIGDGLLLAGNYDGEVLALSSDDGRQIWRTQVSSEVLTPPVVSDGVVVVSTIDGKLFGLSAGNGQRLWVYESAVPTLTLRGLSRPVVSGDRVLSGLANGKVVALSLVDGKFLWEMTVAVPEGRSELERLVDIDGDPVLKDDIFYTASYQGRLVAINTATGRLLWSRDLSSHTGLAINKDYLYVSDNDSTLWALDRFNGAIIWKQDKFQQRSITAPVPYKDYIVVGDFAGYLHWLTQKEGRIVARRKISDLALLAPPVVGGDILFASDEKGMVAALRAD